MDKPMAMSQKDAPNPLQQMDRLYEQLVSHYGDATDREIRAASKLLLVALEKFQQHGGPGWINLVEEYALEETDFFYTAGVGFRWDITKRILIKGI